MGPCSHQQFTSSVNTLKAAAGLTATSTEDEMQFEFAHGLLAHGSNPSVVFLPPDYRSARRSTCSLNDCSCASHCCCSWSNQQRMSFIASGCKWKTRDRASWAGRSSRAIPASSKIRRCLLMRDRVTPVASARSLARCGCCPSNSTIAPSCRIREGVELAVEGGQLIHNIGNSFLNWKLSQPPSSLLSHQSAIRLSG